MTSTDYNLIDDYLLNRLEGKALEDFENRLQSDTDFARAFAEQKKSMELVNKMADLELKMEVQEVRRKIKQRKNSPSIIRKLRPWIAAASVLLLLAVSYWMLKAPSADQLYDTYYVAYNTGFGTRDAANEQEIKLAEASAFYKQKEFDKAIAIFESQSNASNSKLQLMKGICYLELDNYDNAIESFAQLIETKDPAFQYHANWYAAMTHLASGDINNSKVQLKQIIAAEDPNGVFNQEKAKELLKKLEK